MKVALDPRIILRRRKLLRRAPRIASESAQEDLSYPYLLIQVNILYTSKLTMFGVLLVVQRTGEMDYGTLES